MQNEWSGRRGRLAKKLKVEPVKKTNLIAIGYEADDPQVAAKVLHSLENGYLQKHLNVHRPTGELPFFAQQVAESERQLEESKRTAAEFHHRAWSCGGRAPAGFDPAKAERSGRESQADARSTWRRRNSGSRSSEANWRKLPERTTTQMRSADNPELLKALKSSLSNLRAEAYATADKVRAQSSTGAGGGSADSTGEVGNLGGEPNASARRDHRQECAI